jgi:hypothetical protein
MAKEVSPIARLDKKLLKLDREGASSDGRIIFHYLTNDAFEFGSTTAELIRQGRE